MDPVTAAGLAVGIVSLAFDVFDGSVKRELHFHSHQPETNRFPSFQISFLYG